jgi:hypothetical protein
MYTSRLEETRSGL